MSKSNQASPASALPSSKVLSEPATVDACKADRGTPEQQAERHKVAVVQQGRMGPTSAIYRGQAS